MYVTIITDMNIHDSTSITVDELICNAALREHLCANLQRFDNRIQRKDGLKQAARGGGDYRY